MIDEKAASNGSPGPPGVGRSRQPERPMTNWRTFDPDSLKGTPAEILIDEARTFRSHLDVLLKDEGRYVLIKGEQIVGIYDTMEQALDVGAGRFGTEPALIRRIAETEEMITFGVVL